MQYFKVTKTLEVIYGGEKRYDLIINDYSNL